MWNKPFVYEKLKELRLLELVFLDFTYCRLRRLYLVLNVLFHYGFCLLLIYYMCKKFTYTQNLQYGVITFGIYGYIITSIAIVQLFERKIKEVFSGIQNNALSINCANSQTRHSIKYFTNLMSTSLIIITIVFSAGVGYVTTLRGRNEAEFYFPIDYVKENYPEWSGTFYLVFYVTFGTFFYDVLAAPFIFVFIIMYGKFQLDILNDFIVSVDLNESMDLLLNDEENKEIHKRLKFCIKQFTNLHNWADESSDLLFHSILFIGTAALGLGGAICYHLYVKQFQVPLLREASIIAGFFFILFLLAEIGQLVIDICESLHDNIKNLKWYSWNQSNKLTYQIFLVMTKEPIKFEALADMTITRELVMSILRPLYSLATLLPNLIPRDHTLVQRF